jgi:putative FmdB family regulatory protein
MPIYEYKCEACDSCFEKLIFKGDDDLVVCPACGGRKVRKLIGCVSFIGDSIGKICSSDSSSGFS